MKDVIRHNRRLQLGTVAALVNPREIHTESRNSACRTGVSTFSSSIPLRFAYMSTFGSARCMPQRPREVGGNGSKTRGRKEKERFSHTGTRTRVAWVKTKYPNHLDYMGVLLLL